jgi:aminoglycoside phosphotransferase family enzyme
MTSKTTAVDLAAKVAFLKRPRSHRADVRAVTAIETHMAWVFLAGERAYKLKKPVRYPFLDFSTVAARRRVCEEEVRLNRRLAPAVYLGVTPLTVDAAGALAIGGEGAPVDWLVVMQRLARARFLDRALAAGPVAPAELEPAARLLAEFFASATPEPIAPADYVNGLRAELAENRSQLLARAPRVPEARVIAVGDVVERILDQEASRLEARAREHRVVEGHGDLRPEHVFLGPPPAVIDCLEFRRAFRVLDPVDELAFLGLECERLGAPAAGSVFVHAYRDRTGDEPPPSLTALYAAHRALLRAKIAIWHLDDHGGDAEKWVRRCLAYLDLAEAHARSCRGG